MRIELLDSMIRTFYATQAMLTPDDLKAIGALLDEKLDKKLAHYPTKADLDERLREQKTELLVEMSKLRKELLDKIEEQKKDIVNAINELLHKRLLPFLDNHEKRIDRLEKEAGLPPLSSSHLS